MKGFSLIELIIVMGIMAILMAAASPLYLDRKKSGDLDQAVSIVSQKLRRAQNLARADVSDASWGIAIISGNVVLFRGSSYASRLADYDESTTISTGLTVSGLTEVVYSRFTGVPGSTGTVTIVNQDNRQRTLQLNSFGTLTYGN